MTRLLSPLFAWLVLSQKVRWMWVDCIPFAGTTLPKMSAYCSLFEGTYDLGLGALVNSLYRNGFRSTVFAGYRGALPSWANPTSTESGSTDFDVGGGCRIRFLLLDTPLHLTSYKPIFMRQLFEKFLKDEDMLCSSRA